MRIHALTVSVNYADFLKIGAERWAKNLTSWTIVTDFQDEETVKVAQNVGATVHRTDVFYARGAKFNKGAALEQARIERVPWEDWFLLIDADIVPEPKWFDRIRAFVPEPGNLYSAWRYQCDDLKLIDQPTLHRINTDAIGMGYFQLAHTSDAALITKPILEPWWPHAGVYDSHYAFRWPEPRRLEIPGLRLVHLGEKDNWFGRGNKEDFRKMNRERLRLGGYQHERMEG